MVIKNSCKRFCLKVFITLSCLLMGCSHQQIASKRYPEWGEKVFLSRQAIGKHLHIRIFEPSNHSMRDGCILIVHGMNEHVGRYKHIAQHFGQRFLVGGVDLSGHGLTNPILFTADLMIATGADSHDVSSAYLIQAKLHDLEPMRSDLHQALNYLMTRCDQHNGQRKPLFILSHSLGSLVAASYLLNSDQDNEVYDRIAGVIFAGPAFSVTKVPGWRGWLQNPFIDLTFHIHEHFLTPQAEPLPIMIFTQVTSFILVPIVDGFIEFFSWPLLRNLFSPITPDWVVDYLTDWDEEKIRHRQDAYIIRRNVLRYVLGIEKEIIEFRRAMAKFAVPYFLIYAKQDPITPAWGSEDFIAQTLKKHPDNQVLPIPGISHHEHLFSTPALTLRLLNNLDQWLDKRLQAFESLKEVDKTR